MEKFDILKNIPLYYKLYLNFIFNIIFLNVSLFLYAANLFNINCV